MSSVQPVPNGVSSSTSIPAVGFGCWKVPTANAAAVVEDAIRAGYRHIDGACDYGNEKQVGEGIRNAIAAGVVSRADLHVTSKLWNTFHSKDHVRMACKKTLEDLGLEYIDLYIIHFPISLKFVPFETRYPPEWFHDPTAAKPCMELVDVPIHETWAAMEQLVDEGLVRNIGVSNFNCQALRDLFSFARIKPADLQVELHPYLQQDRLVRFAQSKGMHITAYSPLGHGDSYFGNPVSAIKDPVIIEIAKKHGKSPAQVVLRWGVQRGCAVIPKSEKPERVRENLDLFAFALDDDDMARIKTIDRNFRFNDPAVYCEQVFNTFCPIFD